jgi:hypothetical protein
MAKPTVETLMQRADRARPGRDAFATLMRDVYAYAMPERDGWNSYAPGQDRISPKVFDSTAIVATPRFANRLQQAMFPAQQRWARLALPPELSAVPAAQEVQQDLERLTARLFAHIHSSNFDLVANEFAQDLAAGTACMLIQNGRQGTRRRRGPLLRFQCVPVAKVAFDEGPYGTVEGVFFDQELPARLVRRTYPDAGALPAEVTQLERSQPDAPVRLLQATTYDADDDVWRMQVVLSDQKAEIVERSFRSSPWVIARWTKSPGEVHGRGPLTQALPDIRTLNKLIELFLKNTSIEVSGVWTAADDGVLNPSTVRIVPGAVIPVRSNGGALGPSLRRLESGANFSLSDALRQQMQTSIRQVMFDDPLPPEVVAGVTATEIIERVRRFQQDTGAFGRLQADAVTPIVTRCLDILEEAGELADPAFRGVMEALRDDAVRIRAVSPLAAAQDQTEVQAIMQFMSGAAQLGEMGMQLLRSGINADRAGRYVAERVGVPQSLIPTEAELKAQEQAAQQAQQAQALLQSPAVAQVMGQVARGAVDQQAQPQGAPGMAPA